MQPLSFHAPPRRHPRCFVHRRSPPSSPISHTLIAYSRNCHDNCPTPVRLPLSIPILVLCGFGYLSWLQLERIEDRSHFMTENVTHGIAVLSDLGHSVIEMHVNLGGALGTQDPVKQEKYRAAFLKAKEEEIALQRKYADMLLLDSKDRRLMNEFRIVSGEWIASAEQALALSAAGKNEEANVMFRSEVDLALTKLLSSLDEWVLPTMRKFQRRVWPLQRRPSQPHALR